MFLLIVNSTMGRDSLTVISANQQGFFCIPYDIVLISNKQKEVKS